MTEEHAMTELTVMTQEAQLTAPAQNRESLLSMFIASLDIKNSSKESYRRALRQFFIYAERQHGSDLSQLTREHILEYKSSLFEAGLSALTVSAYINSVRMFFSFCEAQRLFPNIAKGIRSPKRKRSFRKQPLTPAQATELLSYFEATGNKRETAIVNLLLRTGLRTIEVIRADFGDITYKGGKRVLLVHGKGREEKDNFVILTDKAYKPLEAYLAERTDLSEKAPLFTSDSNNSRGQRLTTRTVSYIAKEGLKAIGLSERVYTAHSLRHTTAVNILRAGGSLEHAQHTLRHSSPATTQIYTETLEEERRLQNSGEELLSAVY